MINYLALLISGVIAWIIALEMKVQKQNKKLTKIEERQSEDKVVMRVKAMSDSELDHSLSEHLDGTGD